LHARLADCSFVSIHRNRIDFARGHDPPFV